jgi:hypothetical protein
MAAADHAPDASMEPSIDERCGVTDRTREEQTRAGRKVVGTLRWRGLQLSRMAFIFSRCTAPDNGPTRGY